MHATMLKRSVLPSMAEPGHLAQLSALTTTVITCLILITPTPAAASGASCVASERDALAAFRASLLDPAGRLATWSGHSCCRWRGVHCDGSTGHVVKLDLRNDLTVHSDTDWILFYEVRVDIDSSWVHSALALRNTGMKAMRRTTPDGNRGDVYEGSISSFTKSQELHYTFSNYNLVVLLDLSGNSLTGQIPEEISLLLGLKSLNLSGNHLGGKIPNTIGDLKGLESLDLSRNRLSGEIPSSLSELTSFSWLNLSYNNLSGRIPSGHQLQTLNDQEYIYIGNPGLCGPPLRKNCAMRGRHDEVDDVSDDLAVLYLGMSIGFVVSLWLVFCTLLFRK
ncbi:hypothetical protein DAI22_07g136000 [Oryza sativa Japonica Group]|nr:hypothetical protein DAI22_07g136000 [Oryza sativa Japonica Group]